MIIRCPQCEHTRSINESKIPPTAELATCPKCKHRFRFRSLRPSVEANQDIAPQTAPAPRSLRNASPPPAQEVYRPQSAVRENAEQADIWDAVDALHERWQNQLDQHVTEVEHPGMSSSGSTGPNRAGTVPDPLSAHHPADFAEDAPSLQSRLATASATPARSRPHPSAAPGSFAAADTADQSDPALLSTSSGRTERQSTQAGPSPTGPNSAGLPPTGPNSAGLPPTGPNRAEQPPLPSAPAHAHSSASALHSSVEGMQQAQLSTPFSHTSDVAMPYVQAAHPEHAGHGASEAAAHPEHTGHRASEATAPQPPVQDAASDKAASNPEQALPIVFPYANGTVKPEERVEHDMQMLRQEPPSRPMRDLGRLREFPDSVPGRDATLGHEAEIPWENPAKYGWVKGFMRTIKSAMFDAPNLFSAVSAEGSLAPGYLFFLALGYVSIIATVAWSHAAALLLPDTFSLSGASVALPVLLLLAPIALGLMLLFVSGLIRVVLALFAPEQAVFPVIYRIVSYSVAPFILSVVPFVGPGIGALWFLICLILGCRNGLGLSWGLSVSAPLLPAVALLSGLVWYFL